MRRIAINRPRVVGYILFLSPRPNRQGSPGHGTGICIRAEAPLAKSSQASGSVVQWGSPAWRHCPVPFPATEMRRLAPRFGSPTAEREQGFVFQAAPRPRLERGTYCLGGSPVTPPDVAGRGLTCRFVRVIMAGCGLEWPHASARWLPVWLPGISLAALMFDCSRHEPISRKPSQRPHPVEPDPSPGAACDGLGTRRLPRAPTGPRVKASLELSSPLSRKGTVSRGASRSPRSYAAWFTALIKDDLASAVQVAQAVAALR